MLTREDEGSMKGAQEELYQVQSVPVSGRKIRSGARRGLQEERWAGGGWKALTSSTMSLCSRTCLRMLAQATQAMMINEPHMKPWAQASMVKPGGSCGFCTSRAMMGKSCRPRWVHATKLGLVLVFRSTSLVGAPELVQAMCYAPRM